ncbi:oxidoreductase ucpA [Glaciecola punicea ACAM 611]|jgi:NAD(P)-dependent dehydrogenase (short-subunit alcohol dehydrogenase family)|uniref:Oxidoreductase ucpA n=1 Tax=Glaciecola punicea ACAM 611 TaxID=1121923 RepID=H5TDT5_9ALTE|nr:SDR family oxidoreductase [Glaciecola punicea]OFA29790.1 2-deoxy-D-gluconate 3-dehydrogenase [Glaciecola punicea]GAB56462.1 oxidoreductase ucpA [Glaciecola punicea ACAM 611]
MDKLVDIAGLVSLKGKTALITGASSGLGAYFAEVLAELGAEVIVAARREDRLRKLVDKIHQKGGLAHAVVMDVESTQSVQMAFEKVDSVVKNLDILVNNAGLSSTPSKFVDQDDEWEYIIDVNLKGAWRVAKQAAIRMASAQRGCIVNIGSIYSHCTGLQKTDYVVSKTALAQLTRNMALELTRSGVRVNTLSPGYFATEINETQLNSERGKEYINKLIPQRLGHYHELIAPLLLLVSDSGSFVNGISLVVDGGSLLQPV